MKKLAVSVIFILAIIVDAICFGFANYLFVTSKYFGSSNDKYSAVLMVVGGILAYIIMAGVEYYKNRSRRTARKHSHRR